MAARKRSRAPAHLPAPAPNHPRTPEDKPTYHALVTLECPECGREVGVPPGTRATCTMCHRSMRDAKR
jgi:ribosomal protein L44E